MMKLLRWINPLANGKRFVLFALIALAIVSMLGMLFQDASAARFTQRSLKIDTSSAGRYTMSFAISGSPAVGAIRINSTGSPLDVRQAELVSQTGETGFTISKQQTMHEVVFTRKAVTAGTQNNTYIFDGIRNNSAGTSHTVTVSIFAANNASGTPIQSFPVVMSQVASTYTIGFGFPGTASVGSVRMEFCDDPVPYLPCTPPVGLNVVNAVLSSQTGETGFSINYQTNNDIMLSRTPAPTGTQQNTYVLDNVQNPTQAETFYIRLTSYASNDPHPELDRSNYIDYGGVVSSTTHNIGLYSQVAPELIFCLSFSIPQFNCSTTAGGNFVDFGELETDQTYATQTQLVARTNIADGYSISVHGAGVTSGNKSIPSLTVPTLSAAGNSQFGINVVANSSPSVGNDQDGPGPTATINSDYAINDHFLFRSGDTIISTNSVSNYKRYTVSYLLNRSPNQLPGIYATTLTYICSGNF
ncbi:MAG: hypothetical protein WBP26_00945 [Candidatus Saccharimonadales bacterium]